MKIEILENLSKNNFIKELEKMYKIYNIIKVDTFINDTKNNEYKINLYNAIIFYKVK